MFGLQRRRPNPAFYADQLRQALAHDPARADRAFAERANLDLLTWNVFKSLETHSDPDWLGYRLQGLGGPKVRGPVRTALWTGRDREPLLRPSRAYRDFITRRSESATGHAGDLSAFTAPIEVPVRIETPEVLLFVDTALDATPTGAGGRDRVVELIDAGLDQAHRLGKDLSLAFVVASDRRANADLQARLLQLADPARLRAALSFRPDLAPVTLRGLTWRELGEIWLAERAYLDLGGQPARAFVDHVRSLGLL